MLIKNDFLYLLKISARKPVHVCGHSSATRYNKVLSPKQAQPRSGGDRGPGGEALWCRGVAWGFGGRRRLHGRRERSASALPRAPHVQVLKQVQQVGRLLQLRNVGAQARANVVQVPEHLLRR